MAEELPPIDRDRLIKLLGMTSSSFDGEALIAIRQANALLRRHRASWAEVIVGHIASKRQDRGVHPAAHTAQAESSRPDDHAFDAHSDHEPAYTPGPLSRGQAMRARIGRVHWVARWAFFPLYWSALMAADGLDEKDLPGRVVQFGAALICIVGIGAIWCAIVIGLITHI